MPDWRTRVRERLAGLGVDPMTEAEIVEELTQHVEDRYRDLLAGGSGEEQAATLAWRELEGRPGLSREIASARTRLVPAPVQDTSRTGFSALVDDAVYAWRRVRYAPGFAIIALLTVMLTVGANTAILSVADAVLFRPLPYAEPDNVAIIQMRNQKSGQQYVMTPYQVLEAINDGGPSVSEVGLLEPFSAVDGSQAQPTVDTPDGRSTVPAMEATANYFRLLGVRAARGRMFDERDAGGEGRVAVLTHAAWQQTFGGDESIVGKPLALGAVTVDVVGVLPPGFVFPSAFAGRPSLVVLRKPLGRGEQGGTFHAIARVASGVTRERAQAEVEAAAGSVLPANRAAVPVLNDVRTVLYPVGRPIMRFLLAAAAFILLLGCVNLANMMVVRGRKGLHDTAVRIALGASRARIVRPVLFEALMLGLGGALLAVAFTFVTFDALLRQVPPAAYGRAAVGVDSRVVLVGLAMGLLCAVAFSIVPAWRASGVDVLALIQRRGGRGSRVHLGRPLVAIQVAIAVAVVFGATVAAQAFVSVLRTPLGFSADRVLSIRMAIPREEKDRQAFVERAVRALTRRPEVESAGAVGSMPFSGQAPDESARVVGANQAVAGIVHALPGYFETVGIPVRRGRVFTWDDANSNPDAAVVSESAARALFPDRDPLGAMFSNGRDREFRVIGVVGDVVHSLGGTSSSPQTYVMPGAATRLLHVVARMRERQEPMVGAIKADLRVLTPDAARDVEWWSDRISADQAYRNPRFQTMVLVSLASLALGLTALGIFSVVGYLVAARAREMGVRLATGATPWSLVGLVVRQALGPVGLGLTGGYLLTVWGRTLAEAQLFKVDTSDPAALAAATATVLLAAVAAAFVPARRATRINPTEVLRSE